MTWDEVLQTGSPATLRYRVSTDKRNWSGWQTVKGSRTIDSFNFLTHIRFSLRGGVAGKTNYVQAYLFNGIGKSKSTTATIKL